VAAHAFGLLGACHVRGVRVEIAQEASAALALVVLDRQRPQPRPPALGDLAELLRRPAKARAELGAAHVQRDLTGQHQTLIARQLVGELVYAPDVEAGFQMPGDLGFWIGHSPQFAVCRAPVTQRVVQRSFNRATSEYRAAAIMDAREELLLERVGNVRRADERTRVRASARDQLQRGLTEAILEVLAAKPVAMRPQQHVAPSDQYACHCFGGVVAGRAEVSHEAIE
jgi:hypothetical protein